MSFDSLPDTPRARRFKLIAALRDLPPDFTWNFASPAGCHCAMGLARNLGLVAQRARAGEIGESLGLSARRGRQIFAPLRLMRHYGVAFPYKVTPEMVADKLECEP